MQLTGNFLIRKDNWVAAKGIAVYLEESPVLLKVSNPIYKRLMVVPGTTLVLSGIVLLQWEVVVANQGADVSEEATLVLNLWDEEGNLIYGHPVSRPLHLASRAVVTCASMTLIPQDLFNKTRTITVDPLPMRSH